MIIRALYIVAFTYLSISIVFCQNNANSVQNSGQSRDSIVDMSMDSALNNVAIPTNTTSTNEDIDHSITCSSKDSIVYDIKNKQIFSYKSTVSDYGDINLKSDFMQFDWKNNTLTAQGSLDSNGRYISKASFTESSAGTFEAKKISYNFKTEKGRIQEVITQEGEGFIHSNAVKRMPDNSWFGGGSKYTTCNLEHPHFYFESKKIKVIPDKAVVSGPAKLVVADIPTPLGLPFGIFPTTKTRRSGIILPEWGDSPSQGLLLRGFGYYFGGNDYIGTRLTADLYSRGSFRIYLNNQYRWMYKFSGSLNMSFQRLAPVNPEIPGSRPQYDFAIDWIHNQDQKAHPLKNFGGSLRASTRTNNRNSLNNDPSILETQFRGNIQYNRRWRNSPFSLTMSANYFQNLQNGRVTLNLPEMTLSMSNINPFKAKISSSKAKWFERIQVGYNFQTTAQISTIDSLLFTEQVFESLRYGAKHYVNVKMPTRVFKYFNLTPSFTYNDRWYFQRQNRTWDSDTVLVSVNDTTIDTLYGRQIIDTSFGFYSLRDYDIRVSLSTKMFGVFNFKGKRLKAIRHEITPSLNFRYRPDFGKSRFGYYEDVQTNANGDFQTYSPFDMNRSLYGIPGRGLVGSIGFNISNRLAAKIATPKDSASSNKKISLLDQLSFGMNYNLAADSLNLSPLNINGSTNIGRWFSIRFGISLDPYVLADSANRKVNRFRIKEEGRLFRMTTANFTLTTKLNAQMFNNKEQETKSEETVNQDSDVDLAELNYYMNNAHRFYDFSIPWNINLTYNFRINKFRQIEALTNRVIDTSRITQSIRLTGDFNLTPKWKFTFYTGYDLNQNDLALTNVSVIRDLHCWELSFNWTAYPLERQLYAMELRVKSAVLQDLKLTKQQQIPDSFF